MRMIQRITIVRCTNHVLIKIYQNLSTVIVEHYTLNNPIIYYLTPKGSAFFIEMAGPVPA